MSQFSGDYNVVPCRGEHNNQTNLFPPGRHLCLLGMTPRPHFQIHRLCEVLKKILKLDNKKVICRVICNTKFQNNSMYV